MPAVEAAAQETRPAPPDGGDARARFARGQAAYQQGDYEAAIREWNAAYAQDPRPLLQYNLSQAYERLNRLMDAKAALERYIETAEPSDPNQADARARLAALRERLGRTSVRISGGPEGAIILIDGRDVGRTPRPDPIAVEPGSHRVVIRREGFRDFISSVVAPAGESVEVTVEMEEGEMGEGRTAPSQASASSVGPLPYILLAAGGALVVGGVVLDVMALGKADDSLTGDDDDADGARSLALIGDIGIGVGVASAAVGLILLLTSDDDGVEAAPAATALRVTPILAPNLAGASATLQF